MARARTASDDGAAVVEFVLVGVLLLTLFMGIAQVGLYLHMRNVIVASLAEGAREAANADRDCADGVARARDLVRDAIGDKVADGLTFDVPPDGCETTTDGGAVLVRVRAHGPLPLLFPPIGSVGMDATAHAFKEGQ
ncbi:MAG TPA: TadE/TadG family type IV pilus assembly protein [Frankiaceae bacterium]|jgi:Flp pilus assembly protein TadG|nr:TadE/TadG family type IV pilus assembly protein [Frankiaceae bacterium]